MNHNRQILFLCNCMAQQSPEDMLSVCCFKEEQNWYVLIYVLDSTILLLCSFPLCALNTYQTYIFCASNTNHSQVRRVIVFSIFYKLRFEIKQKKTTNKIFCNRKGKQTGVNRCRDPLPSTKFSYYSGFRIFKN